MLARAPRRDDTRRVSLTRRASVPQEPLPGHAASDSAPHGAKDKRVGTSLSKFERLQAMLPSLRPFKPLRFEGDLETSEHNEALLLVMAEFVRQLPKYHFPRHCPC